LLKKLWDEGKINCLTKLDSSFVRVEREQKLNFLFERVVLLCLIKLVSKQAKKKFRLKEREINLVTKV
jgi:hypothetical protein